MLKRTVLSAVAASILATTAVFAQPAPDNAPPPPPRAMQRMNEAHDRLGITPAQQPQWDALLSTLRDNARAMWGSPAGQAIRAGHLDGVQELRAAADVARERADALQRTIPAVEALYAVLSPAQRQLADQDITRLVHGGGHHRG